MNKKSEYKVCLPFLSACSRKINQIQIGRISQHSEVLIVVYIHIGMHRYVVCIRLNKIHTLLVNSKFEHKWNQMEHYWMHSFSQEDFDLISLEESPFNNFVLFTSCSHYVIHVPKCFCLPVSTSEKLHIIIYTSLDQLRFFPESHSFSSSSTIFTNYEEIQEPQAPLLTFLSFLPKLILLVFLFLFPTTS